MKKRSNRFFYFLIGILGGLIVGFLFLFARIPTGIEQDFWMYWFQTPDSREHVFMVLIHFVSAGIIVVYLIIGHAIEKRLERELKVIEEANSDINEFISL